MFRFENFYKEIPLLEKHHNYMEKKKEQYRKVKMAKTAGLLLLTAVVGVAAYKYTGFKNIFKGNFGELWPIQIIYILFSTYILL